MYLFEIGFLPIRVWDFLDVLIVGYLMFQIYKLLRGTIAFNIFLGALTIYVIWWLVEQLKMSLLAGVLKQFVEVGAVLIIIIFQQEIRRFLLFLGNNTLGQRFRNWFRILDKRQESTAVKSKQIQSIQKTMKEMAEHKMGALIVLSGNRNLEGLVGAGVELDAKISSNLLLSLFNKEGPLHDGAVIIAEGRIKKAGVVLPLTESIQVPKELGLRHRAALGLTEKADVVAFVVSEQTGKVSFAKEGNLMLDVKEDQWAELLHRYY